MILQAWEGLFMSPNTSSISLLVFGIVLLWTEPSIPQCRMEIEMNAHVLGTGRDKLFLASVPGLCFTLCQEDLPDDALASLC